ncbi:MAG: hypothetical protein ACLR6I_12925 [Waltera sp.]
MNDVVIPNSSASNEQPQPDGAARGSSTYQMNWWKKKKVCYGAISAEDAGNQLFEKGNQIYGGCSGLEN